MNYRGFDTSGFPGLAVMAQLKPMFDFCGFYLRGPSHPDPAWTGQRAALAGQGWGLAPIFVGQETVGPGAHLVSAAQGELDGVACAVRMAAAGFAPGSHVAVDLENGPPFGQAQADYVAAVLKAITAGGYEGDVYCSHAMASAVVGQLAREGVAPLPRIWAFKVPTTAVTIGAPPFAAPDPRAAHPAAALWQYRQNVRIAVAGRRLLVDLNSARMADPSAP